MVSDANCLTVVVLMKLIIHYTFKINALANVFVQIGNYTLYILVVGWESQLKFLIANRSKQHPGIPCTRGTIEGAIL